MNPDDLFDRTYQPNTPSRVRAREANMVSDFYDTLDTLADDINDSLLRKEKHQYHPLDIRIRDRITAFKDLGRRVDPDSLRPLYDALGRVAQQAVALQNEVAEAVRSPQ